MMVLGGMGTGHVDVPRTVGRFGPTAAWANIYPLHGGIRDMAELIDLTVPIEDGMNGHPLGQPPNPVVWKSRTHGQSYQRFPTWTDPVLNPDGRSFSSENETILMSAHTGTHMDAPVHVDPDSEIDIATVDLERCHTDCVLLDVSDRVADDEPIERKDFDAAATEADVDPAEAISPGDSLFIRTGWSEQYIDEPRYFDHPGLIDSSAKWCLEHEVGLVGIDCPNIDLSSNPEQPSHVGFLRRGWPDSVLVIENLYNLAALPTPEFEVWTLPIPVDGGSGAPARVLARIE